MSYTPLCLIILSLGLLFNLHADESIPKVTVDFGVQSVQIEGDEYLALKYRNAKDWHTYWKNPGDAGLEIKVDFLLNNEELELPLREWPIPNRYLEKGGLIVNGYSGEYAFFAPLSNELLEKLKTGQLTVHSKWLVCKHICIPGEAKVTGSWKDNAFSSSQRDPLRWSQDQLKELFQESPLATSWPKKLNLYLTLANDKKNLILNYEWNGDFDELSNKRNLLTPFLLKPFTFKHEELFQTPSGSLFAEMPVDWDGEFQEPVLELPADGHFKKPYTFTFLFQNPQTGVTQIIEKSISSFTVTGLKTLNNFKSKLSKLGSTKSKPPENSHSIWFYLLMAFLGGLILNLMPCVLPVISIKLFGLIQHQQESKARILRHNLSYSLGVICSFVVLASIIYLLKRGGEQVGWGFQLQSPNFLAVLIIILFIFALNLFGLFEFRTPGGKSLGGLNLESGYAGDFLSGVIATILSTPCSAPFLGTALTFAFTASTTAIFVIFISVGLGLSFPFILTGFFPGLVAFLPKPGLWMEHLKKFLGLTLILTLIWLMDVLLALVTGSYPLMLINAVLALTFFAIYFAQKMAPTSSLRWPFYSLPIFVMILFFKGHFAINGNVSSSSLLLEKQHSGLPWEKWSPDKLQELKQNKDLVFMDFTAKWCITCKVNERLVINTESFKQLQEKYKLRLLLADWTQRDEVIGNWLKNQGYVGVPAYFIQDRQGNIHKLGETISLSKIEQVLEKTQ